MAVEQVEVLVVGAGQAGIAASEHLTRNGIPHLVLERDRIAERWRSEIGRASCRERVLMPV